MPFPYRLRRSNNLFSPSLYGQSDPYSDPADDSFSNISFGASDALDRNTPQQAQPVQRQRVQMNPDDLNEGPTPLSDRYKAFLSAGPPKPQRPDWRTIVGASLAGIGEGPKLAASIMDRPYERQLQQYNLNKEALSDAAKIEGSDEADRIRRVLGKASIMNQNVDNIRSDEAAVRTGQLDDARIKNYKSLMDKREQDAKTQGWQFYTDKLTGHRMSQKANPMMPNGFETTDLGPVDQSVSDASARRVNESYKINDHALFNNLKRDANRADQQETLATNNQRRTQENQSNLESLRQSRPQTPNQEFAARGIAGRKLIESGLIDKNDFDLVNGMAKTPQAKAYVDQLSRGKVIVRGKDKKLATIDKSELADALKEGYTVVIQ